ALTNLTQDHLDYHQTIAAYRDAKVELFANPAYQPVDKPQVAVLNADDPAVDYFAARALGPVVTFGVSASSYQAVDVQLNPAGNSFLLRYPGGETPVQTQLVGSFNVSNSLAVLALAGEMGIPMAAAVAALASAPPVDGRFQRVSGDGGPVVVVDYAHTPDGLEKVLATAHEMSHGRVTVVFGCGGDRDRGKRPLMAAVAAKWAQRIIVTSDNPRSEDPQRIIEEIMVGFPAAILPRVLAEVDRATAIRHAIAAAGEDEMVVLAGKGHENYQIFADRTIHFDDREIAEEALKNPR
ncbi:MAG: UDP-N-acetylmuramoyl-L-alanyl-D-glutamate--2,6-diaminopimelate ligase, partial [bacterium]